MLNRKVLASASIYLTYAFKEKHAKQYLKTADEVFGIIKKAIEQKKVLKMLKGPAAHLGFQRLI